MNKRNFTIYEWELGMKSLMINEDLFLEMFWWDGCPSSDEMGAIMHMHYHSIMQQMKNRFLEVRISDTKQLNN